MQSEYFYLRATRSFLALLTVLYFFVPSILAQYVFHNTFNIYFTSYQESGNVLSVTFGAILLLWIYFFVPKRVCRSNAFTKRILKQTLFKVFYWLFIVYLIVAILYGMKLRMSGAGRLQLFHSEGNFLVPGMGYLLIAVAVYCIASKKAMYLVLFITLGVITDAVFAGKIFSYIAVGTLFLRVDYQGVNKKRFRRIFWGTCILGFAAVVTLAIVRVYMAGGKLEAGLLTSVYLVMEEFMGVQASTGWAVAYHAQHLPMDLLTFTQTLQSTYLGSVGYGLALSPAAYLVGNFGSFAIPAAIVVLFFLGTLGSVARRHLLWAVYLVISINFSHFLRDGINIFVEKMVMQIIFLYVLDQFTLLLLIISKHGWRGQQLTPTPPPTFPPSLI